MFSLKDVLVVLKMRVYADVAKALLSKSIDKSLNYLMFKLKKY